MSLLSIVQDACRHPSLTLAVVSSVAGNTDGHASALFQAAREELDSLANRHEWTKLIKEHTFTTTATSVQVTASAFPADFDRMVNESMFNRTQRRHVWGPLTPEEWQYTQSQLVTLVDPSYRFRGNTILITPDPSSGDTIAYEYISKYKARTVGGVEQENWLADNDTSVFPEPIVTLGVIWRYRRGKGYAFVAEQEEYERRVVDAIMRDGSKPKLTSDPPLRTRTPVPPQTPETLVGL